MPGSLDQLPSDVAALAEAVPEAARSIAAASADRWFRALRDSDTFALDAARLHWRFFFERRDGWSFLLFRKVDAFIPLDVRLSTLAMPADTAPAPISSLEFIVSLPPFLWPHPTQADLDRFAPQGSSAANAILFRLGAGGRDILGVRTDRPRLRFSPGETPQPEEPQGGSFSVLPFLLLAGTLEDWFARGMPVEAADIAARSSRPASGPVREVMDQIGEAWRRTHDALANAAAAPNPFYPVHWRAAAFRSDIQIRLDRKGKLAKKQGDVRYSMLLRMADSGPGRVDITAAPGAPAQGVRDAVLDSLAFTPGGRRALARAFAPFQTVPDAFIPGFIESARKRARVVRLEKDHDADWTFLVLPGSLLDREATAIAIAPMQIDELANPPAADPNLDFAVTLLADPFADPLTARTRDVDHLFAWIANFGRWMELVQ